MAKQLFSVVSPLTKRSAQRTSPVDPMQVDRGTVSRAIADLSSRARKSATRRGAPRPATARAMYICWVQQLEAYARVADLTSAEEFHALLWSAVQLGVKQTDLAADQAVAPASVNRWVQGVQTPDEDRRAGILESAIHLLDQAVEREDVVPMRRVYNRR